MNEQQLNERLTAIHKRLQWIADEEARSAWVNGLAARGVFELERDRLIEETEQILDKLTALGGLPEFKKS